jgi:hypothetical protein
MKGNPMRNTTLAVALVASAALVALNAPASLASVGHGNAGSDAQIKQSTVVPHRLRTATAHFKRFAQPIAQYTTRSCAFDLSSIPDYTQLTTVTGCGTTATLSSTVEKRSVPNSWATWGAPPNTEDDTPDLLYTVGGTTLTITYDMKAKTGGVELEPDMFQKETMQVSFYKGPNGTGKLRGTITRVVNGDHGAKLFGAHFGVLQVGHRRGFHSIVITDLAGDDFGIAQIRV